MNVERIHVGRLTHRNAHSMRLYDLRLVVHILLYCSVQCLHFIFEQSSRSSVFLPMRRALVRKCWSALPASLNRGYILFTRLTPEVDPGLFPGCLGNCRKFDAAARIALASPAVCTSSPWHPRLCALHRPGIPGCVHFIALASPAMCTSSTKDVRACDISGLMEASVRDRNSVP